MVPAAVSAASPPWSPFQPLTGGPGHVPGVSCGMEAALLCDMIDYLRWAVRALPVLGETLVWERHHHKKRAWQKRWMTSIQGNGHDDM